MVCAMSGEYGSQPSPERVPEQRPDERLVPDHVIDTFQQIAEETSDIAARALEWCAAMQTVFEENRFWRAFPGFRFVSYGFVDTDWHEPRFGIIVYTAGARRGGDELFEAELPVGEQHSFPVVVRKGWRYLGSSAVGSGTAPNPYGGTTTAWAGKRRTAEDAARDWMLLTAAHIASPALSGIQIGDVVLLADGTHATIADVGPPGIDAMVLALPTDPGDIAASHQPLTVESLVAPYSDVDVYGAVSGVVTTKVMSVTDAHGTLNAYIPLRVFLADPCQGGDSGGLVSTRDGRAVGIYTAAIGHPQGGHPPEGVCQHLGQVAYCMSLELRHV